jgi:hypothetical protein
MAPAPAAAPAPVTASDGPATKAADTKAQATLKDDSANLLGLLFPGFKSDAGEHSTGVMFV